jgi:hypothetical protein
MDSERLKKANQFDKAFFERQLQKIREIRLSERMFYQKVTDIYATSVDYDSSAPTTIKFFKIVQDRLFESDFDREMKKFLEDNKKK